MALILVLLTHSEMPWLPGGIVGLDVFFVLSGFLITGLILGDYHKRGTVSLSNFYGRRAKRLLPMATTVLIFIAVVSLILFPTVMQIDTGKDVIAATLYYVNWHFIAADIDYFAFTEGMVSPIQHYWSLSVEEQFYVLWPAILLICAKLATRVARRPIGLMLTLTVVVAAASLAYSIIYSPIDPEAAYFSTFTRIWEILFGAILALVLPRSMRMPRGLAELLVSGGVLAVFACAFIYNQIDPYPGWRALVPVLGTVALIVGGTATSRGLGIRILALPVFQYLGKISYAWYLWHWPFVIFAISLWGHMTPAYLLLVSAAAWIPAQITHLLIEEPLRHSKTLNLHPGRALAIGGVFMVTTVGIGFAVKADRIGLDEAPEQVVAGAMAPETGTFQQKVNSIRPIPERAREDRGTAHAEGCLITGPKTESGDCRFANTEDPVKRVVLYGDSHGLQYAPAVTHLADERGWQLTVLTRGNCLVADTEFDDYCDRWRANALDRIDAEKPDLTIVSSSTLNRFRLKDGDRLMSRTESQPYLVEAMAETLQRIKEASKDVVLIRDQARAPFLPFECVADHSQDLAQCVFDSNRRRDWAFDYDAAKQADVQVIDPDPKLCPNGKCPSVIGNALVYRDTYHLSATFSKTLASWLAARLPGVKDSGKGKGAVAGQTDHEPHAAAAYETDGDADSN